jgi:hypothetical protein
MKICGGIYVRRDGVAGDQLLELAKELVSLDAKTMSVRARIKALALNGEDATEKRPPRPTRRLRMGPPKGKPKEKMLVEAQIADEAVLTALKNGPMKQADLCRATGSKVTTMAERLKRLELKDRIVRIGAEWGLASSLT